MDKQELLNSLKAKTGEELKWVGRPKQGLFFTTQDFFLLPFSMFGCGFGYFFTMMPEMLKAPAVVCYLGVLIILISLYFSIFRFIVDANTRSKTFYALSENDVFIMVGSKIKKIELKYIKQANCDTATDGSGSLWFEKQTVLQLFLGNSLNGLPFYRHPMAFLYIDNLSNVHKVFSLLKN